MFCQQCGHENTDDCLFCVSCGANIKEQLEEETIKVDIPPSSEERENSDFTGDKNIPPEKEEKVPPPQDNTYSYSSETGQSTAPLAVASLVIGLVNVLSCCGTWVPFLGYVCIVVFPLLSLLGLILGIAGKIQISRSRGLQKGSGIALAGIIINSVCLLLFLLYIVLVVILGVGAATLPMILENIK